jgi:hypothetical protein
MGPVGPAGSGGSGGGVTITTEPPGSNCANGGTKFTPTVGSPTYACNGTSSTGAGGSFAAGTTGFISCDADGSGNSNITVGLQTQFTNGQFKVKQIDISDISQNCSGKTLTLAMEVVMSPSNGTVVCTKTLSSGNQSNFSTTFDGSTSCEVTSPTVINPFYITVLEASTLTNLGVQIR